MPVATGPRISAVIPAYNAEQHLRRSIDSALGQTFGAVEIIVVDDGSTDGTKRLVESYRAKVRYLYQENRGVSSARNAGIRAARGDWVAFLDADDEWRPGHLENAATILSKHPGLAWYGAPVAWYSERTGARITVFRPRRSRLLVDGAYFTDSMAAFSPRAFVCSSTVIVRASVFQEVGLFREDFPTGEDGDMWFRIGLRFPQVGYSRQVAANVYRRSDSLSITRPMPIDTLIARLDARASLALSMGEAARRRAEPRIIHEAILALRARISRDDRASIRLILDHYGVRLPLPWRALARLSLLIPRAARALFRARDTLSPARRAINGHGLPRA